MKFENYFNAHIDKFCEYLQAQSICCMLQQDGYQAVLAGGCVRDLLSNIKFSDIDIATDATPEQVIDTLSIFQTKLVGEAFGVVLVRAFGLEYEIATFRSDVGISDGRHPQSVKFCSMKEDAKRRDFSMNAIFYDPVSDEIHDFVGGMKDIENKLLRFVGNAQQRLKEDYLRALRYIRFSCKGFKLIDEEKNIVNNSLETVFEKVSKERIILEIKKIFAINSIATVFAFIDKFTNLIPVFFTEIENLKGIQQNPIYHPEGDVYNHTILVWNYLNGKSASFLCQLAGLFHDTGKLFCTQVTAGKITSHGHETYSVAMAELWMKDYKFSNDDIDYVVGIIENHMKFHQPRMSKSTLRKLIVKPYFDDLLLHVEADIASSNQDFTILNDYKQRIEEIRKQPVLPEKFITGADLITLGLKPSEQFGKIISDMYDLQLEGKIETKEQAVCFVRNYLNETA